MYEPNYLAHYGILGMKWGIRRFQPYSVRGRKSGKGGKEIGEAKRKGPSHEELMKSTNARTLYNNRSQLSDKELQDKLNRLRNEQALEAMAHPNKHKGQQAVKQILTDSGKEVLKTVAKKAMAPAIAAGVTWITTNAMGPAIAAGKKYFTTLALSAILRGPIRG